MIFLWLCMEREMVLTAMKVSDGLAFPQLYHAKWAIRIATIVVILCTIYSFIRAVPMKRPDWTVMLVPTCILILICLTCHAICGPLRPPGDMSSIQQMMHDLRAIGLGDRLILTGHVGIDWMSGRSPPPQHPPLVKDIEQSPIGTLVAWEPQFTGSQDFNLSLDDLRYNPSFRLVYRAKPPDNGIESIIWVFEKVQPWEMEPVRK